MRCLAAGVLLGLLGHVVGTEVICYWASWTSYRTGNGKVSVNDLDPGKCTTYIYAFAILEPTTLTMKEHDTSLDIKNKGYERFVAMKKRNPRLKVLLALGGYRDSQDTKYATMLASAGKRATFVRRAVGFLRRHGFDGLDLDYEYPSSADRPHFVSLVRELKAAFRPHNLWLSTATPASRERIDAGFDVPAIARDIDMIHVMAYDMHGSWEWGTADHHAPLKPRASDAGNRLDVHSVVEHWLKRGAPADKLALGVPAYGRSWTVSRPDKRPPAAAAGAGRAGPYSSTAGSLTYLEICEKVKQGWTVVQDPNGRMGPHAYSGDQWVGYDDPAMAAEKTRYAVSRGLGGVMLWDVGSSDARGVCGDGQWPLLTAINEVLGIGAPRPGGTITPPPPPTTARPTSGRRTTTGGRRTTTGGRRTTTGGRRTTTGGRRTTTSGRRTTTSGRRTTTGGRRTTTSGRRTTSTRRPSGATGSFSCPRDGVFPDPDDCNSFYVCSAQRTRCPRGTSFNTRTLSCEARATGCQINSIGGFATAATTRKPSTGFVCSKGNGLYADPTNCRRYISCLSGNATPIFCPTGTGWDVSISSCNWADAINCKD